jgi:hypothetical protein
MRCPDPRALAAFVPLLLATGPAIGGPVSVDPPLDPQPLHDGTPAQREGRFVGVLRVRQLRTWTGCTEPPALNERAVLEWAGNFLPLADAEDLGPLGAKALIGHGRLARFPRLWTHVDLLSRGLAPGQKVAVNGALGSLYASGTEAMMFYPGLAVERIEAARADEPLVSAPERPIAAPGQASQAWSPPDFSSDARPGDETASEAQLYLQIRDDYLEMGLPEDQTGTLVGNLRSAWDRAAPELRHQVMLRFLRELRASVETYHQARAKAGVKVGASESAR